MDELNQVLDRMRLALEERKTDILPISQAGSINAGGNLSTLQQRSLQNQAKQTEQKPQLCGDSKNTNALRNSNESKIQFCEFLSQCYDGLNTYGKTPEQLENLTGLFLEVLGGYPIEVVKNAFLQHIKRSSNLPTPADIMNIIDPLPEELSPSMYVSIMKECTIGGKLLWGDKKRYVEEFERREMAKVRGGSDVLRDCQSELARLTYEHNKPDGGYE